MINSYLGDKFLSLWWIFYNSYEGFRNWSNFYTSMSFDKFSSLWYFFITLIMYHHTDNISLYHWVSMKLVNFVYRDTFSSHWWTFIIWMKFHLNDKFSSQWNFLSHWRIFILLIPFHHINGFSSNSSILMTKNNDINQLLKPHTLTNLITYVEHYITSIENHLVLI